MLSDADAEGLCERLRSGEASTRARAADEACDGVSAWGRHSYTGPQAATISGALVEALEVESDGVAREAIVNALAEFVAWDLAPADQVSRALGLPRPIDDPAGEYWADIEEWARRHSP